MISLFQQTLFFMISKYMLKKWVLNSNPWGNRKGWFSYFLSFAMIKSPWWRCSVCWKSVLDLFWQMFALSVRASYLKWQTVWCHLSNKNLWEFSFCPSFSSTSSIFSLPVSYSAKSGRQQRPPHAMHWPEIQNWFLPHLVGIAWIVQKPLPCCDYCSNSLPWRKEIRERQNRNPGKTK